MDENTDEKVDEESRNSQDSAPLIDEKEVENATTEDKADTDEDFSRHLAYLFPKQFDVVSGGLKNDSNEYSSSKPKGSKSGTQNRREKVNFGVVVKNTKLYEALKKANSILLD